MAIAVSLRLSIGGAAWLSLASPNQGWLRQPLSRGWLPWAAVLVLLSWPAWMRALDPKAGFFAALTVLMLLLGLLPLLSLLRRGDH